MEPFSEQLVTCLTVVCVAVLPLFLAVALVMWGLIAAKLMKTPRATLWREAGKVGVTAAVPALFAALLAGAGAVLTGLQLPHTLLDAPLAAMLTAGAVVVGVVIQQRAAFLARGAGLG